MNRFRRRVITVLIAVTAGLAAGCEDFIRREAQQALAAFLTGIVTTAIDETVGPDD